MTDDEPCYPDLETDMVDRSGEVFHIRPIHPEDAERLVRFHEALSPESSYKRYFSSHRHLSPAEVHHLTEVDGVDRLALVAERGGELIGVGRFDRPPGSDSAEVAFVVADACQHHGIGGRLFGAVAQAARDRGVACLTASVLMGNPDMLAVFTESGYPVRTAYDVGVVEVEMDIS